ncbi:MAG: tripartite tricarboxylate transporter substrate binding protein [Hyphomicrobiales bacterium]
MIRAGSVFVGLLSLAGLLVSAAAQAQAQAQSWPSRFVRMVVPGGSGTAADVSARIIAQALSERWGQQVVVENRPGAGGVAGTVHIAQSAPDGYSLLFAQGAPLSLTPHALKSVPYDVERDFEPISFATYGPLVLAASPKLPVNSVADVIELARRQPGKLSFATASSRSIPHLAAEYFLKAANVDMLNIPYNGYPRAIQDTITGTVDLIFGGAQIIPQRENGNLRMLGVTTAKRLPDYADIPTIGETVPGYAISGWAALLAPKSTPAPIVARINADMRHVLDLPEVAKRLNGLGNYPDTAGLGTPAALTQFIRDDSALMARILKAANLAPEDAAK